MALSKERLDLDLQVSFLVGRQRRASELRLSQGLVDLAAPAAGLGLAGDDGECVVRRELLLSGPNRVFINGHLSTLGALRRLAATQLTLHGQSRHLILATPEAQGRFLDQAALPGSLREDLASAWRLLSAARQESAAHQQRLAEGVRELDMMRFQLGEIEAVAPQPGEQDALRREERLLATCRERSVLFLRSPEVRL